MGIEDDRGWEYFDGDPMMSAKMKEHMDWHEDPANKFRTGNYGERFLLFHKQYVDKFDDWRISKGWFRVSAWDPATPIPAALSHDHVLTAARHTDDPSSVDPHCKTPTWATLAGGADVDPVHGYTKLSQFQSLDELGFSIDAGWHGVVHNTIGGDMAEFHSPIDPIFWRWHRWIDNVRATWQARKQFDRISQTVSLVRILFGVINDAPGVVIGPDGKPHPWPGPGDPWWMNLSPVMRDLIVSLSVNEIGALHRDAEFRKNIQRTSVKMLNNLSVHLEKEGLK